MNLVIVNRQRARKINTRFLRQITNALLNELKIAKVELGITLVGAQEMARVNWQFLGHEGSTDVITFDHREERETEAENQKAIHGELYICLDDAMAQATRFRTSWQSEMVRYVVQGVLHLLGYDDREPQLKRHMKRAENRLVRWLEHRFSLAQLSRAVKLVA